MQDEIEFNGVKYISLQRAAADAHLSRDYIARLCKKGVVEARRVGNVWYTDSTSVRAYLKAQEHASEYRRKELALSRSNEYREKAPARPKESPVAVSATVSEEPVKSYAADVQSRMRSAVEKRGSSAVSALSAGVRTPGVLHAAVNFPVQALAHMPTHTISPALEFMHRFTALVGAFILVFGAYSVFDSTYAATAYDSFRSTALTTYEFGQRSRVALVSASNSAGAAVTRFSENPALTMTDLRSGIGAVYTSVSSFASRLYPRSNDVMTAAAADAVPAPASDTKAADSPESAAPVSFNEPVAVAVEFTGAQVAYGDLISFDPSLSLYTLTHGADDANVYGVVVRNPALLFRPDGGRANISVVRSGSALINVTLENGPIMVGDKLTSSSVPGKARLAKNGEHVVGVAAEAFAGGGVQIKTPDGSSIESGTIKVSVKAPGNPGSNSAAQQASCTTFGCRVAGAINPDILTTIVRYILSGVIAALTLTFAFKSFMSDANYGVISIGRNPNAKSSIQSLVLFNAMLALMIAGAGLFAAMVVLFAG